MTVTVRDDGVGHRRRAGSRRPPGRAGSGVQASVRGRLADVGGTVRVHSAPGQGTEVELRTAVTPRPTEGVAGQWHGDR